MQAWVRGVLLAVAVFPSLATAQECEKPEDCPNKGRGLPCPLETLLFEDLGGYVVPPVKDRPFNPDSGDKLRVRGFRVEGVTETEGPGSAVNVQLEADRLFAVASGGAPEARLTVGQMARIADAITSYVRGNGYLVAKAFLPVQSVAADGIVRIQVLEGRVADVGVEGNNSYRASVLARSARPLVGEVPTRENVEAALLYTQDYPGVRLFGTFKPGAETGDTRLILQVLDEDRFSFRVGGDNYGNQFTGRFRLRGDATWNNPIGFGDALDLTALQSLDPEDATYGAVAYRFPLYARGLTGSVSANQNAFAVAQSLGPLTLDGEITMYEAAVDWRFLRSRFANLRSMLTYAHKESELVAISTLAIVQDSYDVAAIEIGADRVDTTLRGVDQGSIRIRQGLGGDSLTAGTTNALDFNFTAVDLRYVRLQPLFETQTLVLRLRAQHTDTTLVALEKFSPAGPDGVRAYPVGAFLADTGQFAALEYRVQAPFFARSAGPFGRQWGDLLQFWVFGDYAYAEEVSGVNRDIAGYGVAMQFGVPGTFSFQVQGAKALTNVRVAGDAAESRVYGEFSVNF